MLRIARGRRLVPQIVRHCSSASEGLPYSRLTKIVATIGPASEEAGPLNECIDAGMNIMRVNFSHATVEEFHLRRTNLRAAPGGEVVPIMLDTKGPEIRMGGLRVCKESGNRKAKISLEKGETLTLTTDPAFDGQSDSSTLFVAYDRLAEVITPGDRVLLDDGLVSLRVESVGGATDGGGARTVETTVLNSSEIGERKGVNLPGVSTGLPAMSDKDREDIRFGIEHGIDMIAASFVRSAEGVEQIRAYAAECHERYNEDPLAHPIPLIISKIESEEALPNLEEIVGASDGIMVARGDLGVEVPIEQVTSWQKDIVDLCLRMGKPVIVATQMLESMQKNPRPTRAEVADVTNAVLEGADCVMLSGESANGQYPAQSVAMQASICATAEQWARDRGQLTPEGATTLSDIDACLMAKHEHSLDQGGWPEQQALAAAACFLAERVGASCVVVADEDGSFGDLAKAVAAHRPTMPVAALCQDVRVARQLAIWRGVVPLVVSAEEHLDFFLDERSLQSAECVQLVAAKAPALLGPGETAVVLTGDTIATIDAPDDDLDDSSDGL